MLKILWDGNFFIFDAVFQILKESLDLDFIKSHCMR